MFRRRRFLRLLAVFLLLCLVGFCYFRYKYNSVIQNLAQTQVKNSTSDLINDAIDHQIENGNIQYDRIVYFEKDLNGRITALKTNMSEVNRLKTDILNIVNDEILALDSSNLGIPIGSLIFPEFFSGRGPSIPVSILSIRNSDATFSSSFTEAGINQTLHQIRMNILVKLSVMTPTGTVKTDVMTDVVVAETVIVGTVPTQYFSYGSIQEGMYQ